MAIMVTCACKKRFRARDIDAGKRARCPLCGQSLVVPLPRARKTAAQPTSQQAAPPAADDEFAFLMPASPLETLPAQPSGPAADFNFEDAPPELPSLKDPEPEAELTPAPASPSTFILLDPSPQPVDNNGVGGKRSVRPWRIIAVAASVLVLAAGGTLAFMVGGGEQTPPPETQAAVQPPAPAAPAPKAKKKPTEPVATGLGQLAVATKDIVPAPAKKVLFSEKDFKELDLDWLLGFSSTELASNLPIVLPERETRVTSTEPKFQRWAGLTGRIDRKRKPPTPFAPATSDMVQPEVPKPQVVMVPVPRPQPIINPMMTLPPLPPLNPAREAMLDTVVDRVIQYDLGRIRGIQGQQAIANFRSLGPDAIPALLRGLQRALTMDASCPVVVISTKLSQLLSTTPQMELVNYAYNSMNFFGRYQNVVQGLRSICETRLRMFVAAEQNRQQMFQQQQQMMDFLRLNPGLMVPRPPQPQPDQKPATRPDARPAPGMKPPVEVAKRPAPPALTALDSDDVPTLVKKLKSGDKDVRLKAAAHLVDAGPSAVPLLIEALQDKDARCLACLVLAQTDPVPEGAMSELMAGLADKDQDFRRLAHYALVKMGKPAVLSLTKAVQAPETRIRFNAIVALGRIGAPAADAIPVMKKSLESTEPDVRLLVTDALLVMGPEGLKTSLEIGEKVPDYADALKHPNKLVRAWAAASLGRRGPDAPDAKQAAQVLADKLHDADVTVRMNSATALGQLGPQAGSAIPALMALEKRSDPERVTAHAALILVGKGAVPALVETLQNQDPTVRQGALAILYEIGPATVPTLCKSVSDPRMPVRMGALQALLDLGPRAFEAIPTLQKLVKDPSPQVRARAIDALREIEATTTQSLEIFVSAFEDPSEEVRIAGHLGLIKADKAAAPVLASALRHAKPEVREWAVETIKKIGGEGKNAAAIRSLAPDLIEALKDSKKEVRDGSGWALEVIDPQFKEVLPALHKALNAPQTTAATQGMPTDLRYLSTAQLVQLGRSVSSLQIKPFLSELQKRQGNDVLVALACATVHQKADFRSAACPALEYFLSHKPAEMDEQKAVAQLKLTKVLARDGRETAAQDKYRKLIRDFPATKAAEEARKLVKAP